MQVNHATTGPEFVERCGWTNLSSYEIAALDAALRYFIRNVPLGVLNAPDRSSPWTPGNVPRTRVISWIQSIHLSSGVNASRRVEAKTRLKQYRMRDESSEARGSWFTWLSTKLDKVGLPDGQDSLRLWKATQPFDCLECTCGDVFAGWVPYKPGERPPYKSGGGRLLFIYHSSPAARHLVPDGGASRRK